MKKLRKIVYNTLLGVSFLLVGVVVCGCKEGRKGYLVGVSQCNDDAWHKKLDNDFLTLTYIRDSLDIHIMNAQNDSKMQARQIDSLVNMGIDMLIVSPNDMKSVSSAIERAYDKGIPVVLYDRKIHSDKYSAFIGSDDYAIGKEIGEYVVKQLKGKGRVVEIRGTKDASPTVERYRGFSDVLNKYPGVEIVASEYADWEVKDGALAMSKILKKTDDIDYVFAYNDLLAYGAYQECKKEKMAKMPKIVGVDGLTGENGGLEYVAKGILDASFLNATNGDDVIKFAAKVLHGQPVKRDTYLPTMLITKDRAELACTVIRNLEKRSNALQTLHNQVERYESYTQKQGMFLWLLGFFLFVVAISAITIYREYMSKKKLSVQLAKKNFDLKKLNDEVGELTQSRLAFFTNVSHELRTPLTLIVDPIKQILEKNNFDARTGMLLRIIERNALTLKNLVDEIMDFRKIESGKMELRLDSFDLAESLKQWVANFYPMAEKNGVKLTVTTDKFTHRSIVADKEKLGRMVFNLLSNAMKYTDEGGQITVSLADAPSDRLVLSVEDTGRGISAEDQKKVFDRFFQAKNSEGGTGIGLTMVKAGAELHNGSISVDSQLGKGSVFSIILPCSQEQFAESGIIKDKDEEIGSAKAQDTEVLDAEEEKENVGGEKATLLIIDDNRDIRDYIVNVFGEEYVVYEASNGKEGLDLAMKYVPDIVVCDVMMPVMDGIEFCSRLRQTVATSHIPVILLTAKNMEEHRIDGYEHGADSYITKPFSSKLLRARIENLLKSRKLLKLEDKKDVLENVNNSDMSRIGKSFFTKLYDIIEKNLSDSDFGVEAIGEEIGLSRVQLYRKVKAVTGMSVVDLLRKSRLRRSKKLLEETDKSISEIAYEVGFSSPSYFTKCFKDEYGKLPGDIRNS